MAEDNNDFKTINTFFSVLHSNPKSVDNLKKAIEYNLFNKMPLVLEEYELTKILEDSEIELGEISSYEYEIWLKFKYPPQSPLSQFIKYISIKLESPKISQIGKDKSIYFTASKIDASLFRTYEKISIPINFIVYYSFNDKSFKILID